MSMIFRKEIIKLRKEMEELKKELINKIEENNISKETKKELLNKIEETESEFKKSKKRAFRG